MAPPQTYPQFFRKFVRWAYHDLRRHYQPLNYSDSKGPEYHRPVGYDDRPLLRKVTCRYVWVRFLDHVICGLVSYYYDNRVYFHKRYPNRIADVKGPLESYLPPVPKRFPDEFIKAERSRMKKFDLPPNEWYVEFDKDPIPHGAEMDLGPSILDYGKTLSNKFISGAVTSARQVDVTSLRDRAANEAAKILTTENKDAVKAALNKSQDLTQRAIKGDVRGAASEVKVLLDTHIRDNQALRQTAKETTTALQQAITSFVKGYEEGKKYEEIAQTDPRDLLRNIQATASKAVLVVARDAKDVMKSDADLLTRLTAFSEKAKTAGSRELNKEEEAELMKEAQEWMKTQGMTLQSATQDAASVLANTREIKAARTIADRATAVAKERVIDAQDTVTKQAEELSHKMEEVKDSASRRLTAIKQKVEKVVDDAQVDEDPKRKPS